MDIGPKLNYSSIYNEVLGEDQLGIKYVAINMSDVLQSGITSVTPRARYWSFYTWVLYDFIFNTNIKKTENNLKAYMKRQEWYFILSNIAYGREIRKEPSSLQGIRVGNQVWNENPDAQTFDLNDKYISNAFGGYGVYRNVIKIMGLTRDSDSNKNIKIDFVTKTGEQIALAFEDEIKDSEYYKKYRLSNIPVPKKVLIQYGEKVHLSNIGKTKDGIKLIELFLPKDTSDGYVIKQKTSLQYYQYVLKSCKVKSMTEHEWRLTFYDIFSPKANPSCVIPESFRQVALGWEVCTTRMYFTYSLEGIWSRTLYKMENMPLDMISIIDEVLYEVDKKILRKKITSLIGNNILSQEDRENIIEHLRNVDELSVISGLQIMLDVYQRLSNRDDFDDLLLDFLRLGGQEQISLYSWIDTVNNYKDKTVKELLVYVLQHLILNQHLKTALDKLCTTRNQTFHFVQEDGILHWVSSDRPAFNVMRVIQGISILTDLELI
ncbi:hypothetical protein QA584_12680 [Anaerocolumna sp. AGMB13025]|uniref:hypothetical protein n=1 Tax=Anaerocolumna sp. AGMB13025 TaxID=3039116 RepID=UPI00241E9166|nr:hypothetical protein [Anaerocolumna sp. AGMB13025]WFR59895.1 hypothetical protein QA584_12680 [Anaerocolumna sp. AGMB13025]